MNSYFTLRSLTEPTDKDLGATFSRMSDLLDGTETARLQFLILSDEKEMCWSLELGKKANRVHAKRINNPDFELITKAETWWQIAEGALSPMRAFVTGKMRVRGDIDLGQRILKQLASSEVIQEEEI